MNDIFKGLLSLHGYPLPFESVDGRQDPAGKDTFASGYGNRVASQRRFAPLGRARRLDAEPQPTAQGVCVAGGCG